MNNKGMKDLLQSLGIGDKIAVTHSGTTATYSDTAPHTDIRSAADGTVMAKIAFADTAAYENLVGTCQNAFDTWRDMFKMHLSGTFAYMD